MEKIISIAVPCYNSEAYLNKCLDSMVPFLNDIEVIIINDGSKDSTLQISNYYLNKYPNDIKVIDKENGGHGSGINVGFQNSTGLYYKVVDSDDWIDESTIKLIKLIKEHRKNNRIIDLYMTDFVRETVSEGKTVLCDFWNYPKNVETSFDKIKRYKYQDAIMMHALLIRREILENNWVDMPLHTFYEDNYYAYAYIPYIKNIYYFPIVWYHYYIGRPDQSINFNNITKRYEQQFRVMELIAGAFTIKQIKSFSKGTRKVMFHHLRQMITITKLFCLCGDAKDRPYKLKEFMKNLKKNNKEMYHFLKYTSYTSFFDITFGTIRKKLYQKIYNIGVDRYGY
jgi:glycosyltransferase involved in cell wall biosynthesis